MGLEAAVSGSGPPPFDMGALFGLGVKPGVDMEKGVRWEGPGLPKARNDDFWTRRRQQQRHEQDARITQFFEIPQDPVETSRASFEAMLTAVPDAQRITLSDFEPLLTYLTSDTNEPGARLSARLFQWLCGRPASEDCLQSLVSIVKQKLALDTMLEVEAKDILQILHKHMAANEHFVAVATSLPSDWAHRIFLDITRQTLSSPTDQLERVREWLACLRCCDHVRGFGRPTHAGWSEVYAEVSKAYLPSELADHFSKLRRRGAAVVLLRHWVPKLAGDSPGAFADAQNEKRLSYASVSVGEDNISILTAELRQLHEKNRQIDGKGWSGHPLLDFLQVLEKHRVPYQAILAEILSIYRQAEPASKLRNLVKNLTRYRLIAITPAIATSVIQSFVDSGHVGYAYEIFKAVPSVPLSDFYDLALQLIQSPEMRGSRTFALLTRLTVDDTVPPEERTIHHTMALKQGHVDLIHLVAYAHADCSHVSSRAALRRVWECYRFLKDRHAPLDPLISRAFVKAGISRPLAEGKRPGAKQTAYILEVVSKLEGKNLARKLDELVFKVGRRIASGESNVFTPRYKKVQEVRNAVDRGMLRDAQIRLNPYRAKRWTMGRARSEARKSDNYRIQNVHNGSFEFQYSGTPAPLSPEKSIWPERGVDTTSAVSYAPLDIQQDESLESERQPAESRLLAREPERETSAQHHMPKQAPATNENLSDGREPVREDLWLGTTDPSRLSAPDGGLVHSIVKEDVLQKPNEDLSFPAEDMARDLSDHINSTTGAFDAEKCECLLDGLSEAGIGDVTDRKDVSLEAPRPATSYASMLGGADAPQFAPLQVGDFLRQEYSQPTDPVFVQSVADTDGCEDAIDHFDAAAWPPDDQGAEKVTHSADEVAGPGGLLSATSNTDAVPSEQVTSNANQYPGHEPGQLVWRAGPPRIIQESARERALRRWQKKQTGSTSVAAAETQESPDHFSLRPNSLSMRDGSRMPDYQHYAKFLNRRSFMMKERKAQAINAVGWQGFAEKARMRRMRAGYDSWTKVKKEKRQGSERRGAGE